MRVLVNGVRLYFDVEGVGLVPDGAAMRAKPTLILLHGGPGFDHTIYKPTFAALADIMQVVYLDQRGNGRSDRDAHENWNLAQWGDDVRAFCDALEIAQPIVYGASFGGMVALAYATRHPDHPAKLILVSTEARGYSHLERRVALFERLGGPEVGALARRRFLEARRRPRCSHPRCLAPSGAPGLYAHAGRSRPRQARDPSRRAARLVLAPGRRIVDL